MLKPVFYDPQKKRWRRIRRTIDVVGIVLSLLIAFFVISVVRDASIPALLLATQKKSYHALKLKEKKHAKSTGTHRKTSVPASQVVLNSDEGIRGAFYVTWDAASFSSLREYVHQIDLLFPEWLHVLTPDGRLQGVTQANKLFDVIQNGRVRTVDNRVMPYLKQEKAQMEVLPLVNNFDPIANQWMAGVGKMLDDPAARANFRQQLSLFLASNSYRGVTLDIEGFPERSQPGYRTLIQELANDLHSRGLKLYVSVPANNPDFDYQLIAKSADGLILMNYDQHYPGGEPGPIAGQDWFVQNIATVLKQVPRQKIICAIGNYGYDWSTEKGKKPGQAGVHNVSVQDAWLEARDSEANIDFDSDSLNPHLSYEDEKNIRHDVWYLDAVTSLNQMRAARAMGISTFALWRLGSEDRSLWAVWDQPSDAAAPAKLRDVPPGQDVDMEGSGEILQVQSNPAKGARDLDVDAASGVITDENFSKLPSPYRIGEFGGGDRMVSLTFDDGPDPLWTPKILDALKRENAKATFFIIGLQAERYSALLERIFREGHEIGNHTFTHPDISEISKRYMMVELNLNERLFEAKLGVKPVLFRPPYSIDQEPDTADEVRPLEVAQQMGYITVGDKIDPNDWRDDPRPTAEQIVQSVLDQVQSRGGGIVLLHDAGGNRAQTVAALPGIIEGLRARGYEIVPVATLLGKTYNDVMPPIAPNERFWARVDATGFWLLSTVNSFIVLVFFVGDLLMSGRLVFVGALAIYDRFRRRGTDGPDMSGYRPGVAVLIPAYNEERVIERTVMAVLNSDYPGLRAIVIDDGSKDRTGDVVRETFWKEIAQGRLTVLTQANGGKAAALNRGLESVTEEIFVGIDADTIIAPDAIRRMVPHFLDPKIGALAGNAKVGNKINLWTRWQALEYITSQNFERRALNTFSAVSVVPGAIGAWRTQAVKQCGGYHVDTVAEDADLTMALLQAGYKVEYEDRALAFTEAP